MGQYSFFLQKELKCQTVEIYERHNNHKISTSHCSKCLGNWWNWTEIQTHSLNVPSLTGTHIFSSLLSLHQFLEVREKIISRKFWHGIYLYRFGRKVSAGKVDYLQNSVSDCYITLRIVTLVKVTPASSTFTISARRSEFNHFYIIYLKCESI